MLPINFLIFFWNVLYSKTVKICLQITAWVQGNPMSANISILIEIYCRCPIFYFTVKLCIKQIIAWINTFKSALFWWYLCISKLVKEWGSINLLNLFLYLPHSLLCLLVYFLINVHLICLITNSFLSFPIVWVIPFIDNPKSSGDFLFSYIFHL